MERYDWSEKYSVGVAEIDRQHRRLLEIMARLHRAMLARESREIVGEILAELVDYTGEHFAFEEDLMRCYEYPGYEDHKRQHDELRRKVVAMSGDHKAGKVVVSMKLMEFLVSWLTGHIMGRDFLYRELFHSEGLR